jgi:quercetin dioxygenase-like cupin family protein
LTIKPALKLAFYFPIIAIHSRMRYIGLHWYLFSKGDKMQESEVVAKTDALQVRIMNLKPREVAAWHYHTQVTDDIFCLTGMIAVRLRDPDHEIRLLPGGRYRIETGKVHQLENLNDLEASYLLVQGIGQYDFNVVPQDE